MFIISLFIFILGLVVGSFLNVVICRLYTGEKILFGRSHCLYCKKDLKWFDLIPLVSFISTFGKCRYCSRKISLQYPMVEMATGLLFLLIFNFKFLISNQFLISNFLNLFYYLVIVCFLIIIFVYDLKHYIIPDKIIYPAIGVASLYQIIFNFQLTNFCFLLLVAVLASLFFLAIVVVSHGEGMGMGDVKLVFLIGLILGWPNTLVALFLAFLLGTVAGLLLIIINKKTLKSEIPFGPFLVTGTLIGLFFGDRIIDWYLSLFICY